MEAPGLGRVLPFAITLDGPRRDLSDLTSLQPDELAAGALWACAARSAAGSPWSQEPACA
eukprot:1872262-Pleurochrysis_carterae.AAC.1